ncbi:MAG: hypothetical protein RRC34_01920 [Lentisphaeria bacterium]|nr:hypothetical protein [Lentisphaeria bacterium]
MWKLDTNYINQNSVKRCNKSHPDEMASVTAELVKLISFLQAGKKIEELVSLVKTLSYERDDVYRIREKGRKNFAPVRLYILIDATLETVFLLAIGGKTAQNQDINKAVKVASAIRPKGKRTENGKKDTHRSS